MAMKNKICKIFVILFLICCCGCGADSNKVNRDKAVNPVEEPKYGYLVTEKELDEGSFIVCSNDNVIYYGVNDLTMDSEGNIQPICTIYMVESKDEALPGQLGELYCNANDVDADGQNLYLLELALPGGEKQHTVYRWSIEEKKVANEIKLQVSEDFYPMAFEWVEDGFFLWNSDKVSFFDASGTEQWTLEKEGEILAACANQDNVIVCIRTFDGMDIHTEFQKYDLASGQLQKKWDSLISYDIEKIAYRNEKDLWVANSRNGVSIYHMESDEYEQVVSWMDEGISDIYVKGIEASGEEDLQLAVVKNGARKDSVLQIAYGVLEKASAKQEILLSMPWVEDNIKEAIVKFNKTNPNYKIVIQTRRQDEKYDDYRTNLGRELATDTAADIFLLPQEDYENYWEKGLLFDLAPLLAADDTVQRKDYFEKVWEQYEEGESLYAIPITFSIDTVVSKKDIYAQSGGWTLDEMMDSVAAMPWVTELVGAYSKEAVLKYCCSDIVARMQIEEMKEEELITILEFANQYGADEEKVNEAGKQFYHMLEEENTLLKYVSMSSVSSVALNKALVNGEMNVVGYPATEPVLAYVREGTVMAIRANSEYVDGAWEFLKMLLSEEVQREQSAFPVLKKMLDEQVSEAGVASMDSVTEGIYLDGYLLPVEKPTKEDVVLLKELIDNSVPYPYETEFLLEIICEEATAYFSGQKTAQEVADIIRNRTRLYLDEAGL